MTKGFWTTSFFPIGGELDNDFSKCLFPCEARRSSSGVNIDRCIAIAFIAKIGVRTMQ